MPNTGVSLGPSGPGAAQVFGSLASTAGTGAVCSLISNTAKNWYVLLDGTNVTTAAITVQFQQWNPATSAWVTIAAYNMLDLTATGNTNLTNGQAVVFWFEDMPGAGMQVAVSNWAGAGGTLTAVIRAL